MRNRFQSLIPAVQSLQWGDGYFVLRKEARLWTDAAFLQEAEWAATRLREVTGFALEIVVATSAEDWKRGSAADLQIWRGNADAGQGGYRLSVTPETATVEAGDGAGAFYGLITLFQLFPSGVWGAGPRLAVQWSAQCCEVQDRPRFQWRGLMLDSARHFQTPKEIKVWIDLLAQHKFNVFHWHLTDNQGWRIAIDRYPKLTEVGAWRSGTMRGHALAGGGSDGVRYGGFYTKAEIREIVTYASERHITIVPEIDMPGHAQAAVAAYPEFGMSEGPCEVSATWLTGGSSSTLLNPFPKTFQFITDVLAEVIDLFPSEYIHIGGDEVAYHYWAECPNVARYMEEAGLADIAALRTCFQQKIAHFLRGHGRKVIGWDEIVEAGLPEGAAVMAWRGHQHSLKAIHAGSPVVMASYHATYLDYYQSPITENEPLGNRDLDVPYLPLETVYHYEPVPVFFNSKEEALVLGVQGQLWSEYLPTFEQVQYMAFPRACALAEVAWSGRETKNFEGFKQRLKHHLGRFDCQGVRYRPLKET